MAKSLLDDCFAALADPVRRGVLDRLRSSDATIGQLARPARMTLTGMRKHVAVLERAGLVRTRKQGRERRVQLHATALEGAKTLLDSYRSLWPERFDAAAPFIDLDNIDVT